ncbi:MAG TPA: NAD-dependent epimerase/dehydratase family protein [bacterium]|jgi:uncharacterized protein YbjT (DUF2867 family)|nr:NAD-dependent epimerase/dehydratase family protein [bacterium]
MPTALLLGPTGLVGSYLLPLLLEAPEYERVIVLSRRPLELKHPKMQMVHSELADVERHAGLLQADDIFSCLGTTIRLAKTQEAFKAVDYDGPMRVAGLQTDRAGKRFFVVTSLGAELRSSFFYARVKAELERDLGLQGFKKVYVARPSLLLGQRRETRPAELIGEIGTMPLVPLMRGPWRKYRPIQAAAVAENLLRLARGLEAREGMEWALA